MLTLKSYRRRGIQINGRKVGSGRWLTIIIYSWSLQSSDVGYLLTFCRANRIFVLRELPHLQKINCSFNIRKSQCCDCVDTAVLVCFYRVVVHAKKTVMCLARFVSWISWIFHFLVLFPNKMTAAVFFYYAFTDNFICILTFQITLSDVTTTSCCSLFLFTFIEACVLF